MLAAAGDNKVEEEPAAIIGKKAREEREEPPSQEGGGAADGEACPICLQEVGEDQCRTPCGHAFCTACILSTLERPPGPRTAGACPLCRADCSAYSILRVRDGAAVRSPEVSTVIGQVYAKGFCTGIASLHFESLPDGCYVSYARAPSRLKLDDGSQLPERKPFVDASYDEASRTFRGTIDWRPTAWQGAARCEYTAVFSESLETIVDGQIVKYDADGNLVADRGAHFGDRLIFFRQRPPYETVEGAIFVQGGVVGRASYHFERLPRAAEAASEGEQGDGGQCCYISYAHAPQQWTLDDGTRPPDRKPFLDASYDEATRTFRGSVDWRPTAFGGASRWEYRIVFDPLFIEISSGEVVVFGPNGNVTDRSFFGMDLSYARYEDAFEEMGAAMLKHRRREAGDLQAPEPGPFQRSFAAVRRQVLLGEALVADPD